MVMSNPREMSEPFYWRNPRGGSESVLKRKPGAGSEPGGGRNPLILSERVPKRSRLAQLLPACLKREEGENLVIYVIKGGSQRGT